VDPEMISRYMFGTRVATDWQEGSPITWEGEWEGQRYEDKGTVIEVEPLRALEFSHFSPLTGLPDVPANYHDVRIEIEGDGSATTVSLTQDNNETAEAQKHSEGNWQTMLDGLKKIVEEGSA
jgi:uncharacterized protein YndB with AHSA1/START domain